MFKNLKKYLQTEFNNTLKDYFIMKEMLFVHYLNFKDESI